MNHTIQTEAVISAEECLSVLETWESQAGYWELEFRNRQYRKGLYGDELVSVECQCTDQDGLGEPVEGRWWLINEDTVVQGIQRILAGGVTNCENEVRQMLAVGDIDGCDIDQADAIVQAGLFGTLVYG